MKTLLIFQILTIHIDSIYFGLFFINMITVLTTFLKIYHCTVLQKNDKETRKIQCWEWKKC